MQAHISLLQRALVLLSILVLSLVACGAPPLDGGANVAPPAGTAPVPSSTSAAPTVPQPSPSAAGATAAPAPTSVPAPTTAATIAPTEQPPTAAPQPPAYGSELLFLRQGALTAYDLQARSERVLADSVRDFAATADGTRIALVRELPDGIDLWQVQRDGQGLAQLTRDGFERIEATPSWAPDGMTLVFATADSSDQYTRQWPAWATWCAVSQVVTLDIATGATQPLGAGCDPAVSPDGKRIAFATPPTEPEPGLESFGATIANTLRLVNLQGANGWDIAIASGSPEGQDAGRLVYAPAWSPDGTRLAYQRFFGNQIEVDINTSEITPSFERQGQAVSLGAGWLLPPVFAPDGRSVAIVEHNFSDARGFGGYDAWSVSVLGLEGSREVGLPFGSVIMAGTPAGEPLARAQRAVWFPAGDALAVQLPPGWRPGMPQNEPLDPGGAERLGELWRWTPGAEPEELLVADVDFASPLAWLP
jgi:hypothetical protein